MTIVSPNWLPQPGTFHPQLHVTLILQCDSFYPLSYLRKLRLQEAGTMGTRAAQWTGILPVGEGRERGFEGFLAHRWLPAKV